MERSFETSTELQRLDGQKISAIETSSAEVYALASNYPAKHSVATHRHSRAQLLYPRAGVVMVTSTQGRWMVPPEHALWIPPHIDHSVEMLADVSMLSVYVASHAAETLSRTVRVVALTDLARALIVEAVALPAEIDTDRRGRLIMPLMLDVIANLPDRPLGLPFPADPRLVALCRHFIGDPSPHLVIDDWATALSMSRRSFTRMFARETGVSLSTWRQQACLFTALPRLASGEPITGVALDLGYDSVSAFTTMFKRMLGAPPRAYFRINNRPQSALLQGAKPTIAAGRLAATLGL